MTEARPELSRIVRANEIGKAGLEFTLEANESERAAIADRLGVVSVDALKADVTVKRWRRTGARMIAEVTGAMTRRCVVSLDDFVSPIEERFEVRYADPSDDIAMAETEGELVLDPDSEEPPEILEHGAFDAGEAVLQQLVLTLDPYPRKPGTEFADVRENPEKPSPFAVLEGLKIGPKEPGEKG
jgi:hypothetical protein